MKIIRVTIVAALAFAASGACAQTVRVEGPAAGQGLARVAVADFERTHEPARPVSVDVSGTGAAMAKLCGNEVDLVTAARPILTAELQQCQANGVEFVEVPVAFDAIVVVTNVRNTHAVSFTVEELRRIWAQGAQKPMRWRELNAAWPDLPLKLYGLDPQFEEPSYFREAVLAGEPARTDYTMSVDEAALVRAIERDPLGLAYISLAAYAANQGKLKALAIAQNAGEPPVPPTPETVAAGTYRPLVRPIFLYVRIQALGSPAVKALAEHWVGNGSRLASEAGLVPFSQPTYQAGLTRLQTPGKGSAWDGKIAVGATLTEVEQRQPPL